MIFTLCTLLEAKFSLAYGWQVIVCGAVFLLLLAGIYRLAPSYRRIQQTVKEGWGGLALLSVLF